MLRKLQYTPNKHWLLIFFISTGVGLWAAYDPSGARKKFLVLAIAGLLYLILACWPQKKLDLAIGLTSLLGAGISLFFLLGTDWSQNPADLEIINQFRSVFSSIRISFPFGSPFFHPNIAGGLIAALLPLILVLSWETWRKRQPGLLTLSLLALGLSILALLLTSSRAAWFALFGGLGLWFWWQFSNLIENRLSVRREIIFSIPVMLVILAAIAIFWLKLGNILYMASSLPGITNADSRAEIAWNSLQLSRDFLFTGGGLSAFPGLYARYMRVIEVYEFGYAHNLYLDILIEQGIFGLVSFLAIMIGSLFSSFSALQRECTFSGAVFASICVMLFHGFLDDPFYGMSGTPWLFVLSGLAAIYSVEHSLTNQVQLPHNRKLNRNKISWGITIIILIVSVTLPTPRSWMLSNLASVNMAKLELQGWPNGAIQRGSSEQQSALLPVQGEFERALQFNPANVTALYRMGLIYYQKNDFQTALTFLDPAHIEAPSHRGIRKVLGYNYVWLNQIDKAVEMLEGIPEAASELETFAWWWDTQNLPSLATQAAMAADLIIESSQQ